MNKMNPSPRFVLLHTPESRQAMDLLRYNHINLQDIIRDFLVSEAAKLRAPTKTITITVPMEEVP